jgi:RNA polymerase sigma-70 factor (ECF subfamily)
VEGRTRDLDSVDDSRRRDAAMSDHDGGIEDLFERAGLGDRSAIGRLLERHRGRLRSCVARRIDRRTAARFDLSDVVQETLVDAGRRLPEYLRDRPVGFFPWLNQLARQRLIDLRRTHLGSQKRSVIREQAREPGAFDDVLDNIPGDDTSPSGRAIRDEEHGRLRAIIDQLAERDREILDLRYGENLPFHEIAERLDVGLGAVKMRHLRAIERLHEAFDRTEVELTRLVSNRGAPTGNQGMKG